MISITRMYFALSLFLLSNFIVFEVHANPGVGCTIDGPTTISRYASASFELNGTICTAAASWTITCGSLVLGSQDGTGASFYFNDPNCTSATIAALNSSGGTIASKNITITPAPPLGGGTMVTSLQNINYNTVPNLIDCSSASYGSCGGSYNYQWFSSSDNTTFYAIGGATGQNFQPGALTATTYFKRSVSCGYQSATSDVATINVYPALISGIPSPLNQTINYNTAPSTLLISSASGGNGSYSYQWQSSTISNGTFSPIGGVVSTSYSPGALASTTYYNVLTTSNGAQVTSSVITVNVYPELQGGTINPSSLNINYNRNPGQLNAVGVSGGNGTYSYQWQSSADASSWSNIPNAETSSYSPGNLIATTYFRVIVTSNGVSVPSQWTMVLVYPQLSAGSISPGSKTIAYNTSPGIFLDDEITGGNGSYSYQWQISADGNSWDLIQGASGTSYNPGNITSRTWFRLAVSSGGVSVTTNPIVIDVLQQGAISPSSFSINYNTSPGTFTVNGAWVSSGSNINYQWQQSSSSSFSSPSDISGAVSADYSPGSLTSTTYYRVAVTSDGFTVYTGYVSVNVYSELQPGGITPLIQYIGYNTIPSSLTITGASGGDGNYSYQWYSSEAPEGPFVFAGTGSTIPADGNLTTTIYYKVVVFSNGVTATTGTATINVLQGGGVSPASKNIFYNTTPGELTAVGASGGDGEYLYSWESSADNTFANPVSEGVKSVSFTPSNLTVTTYYRVNVKSGGATTYSNYAEIMVYPELKPGRIFPSNVSTAYNTSPRQLYASGASGGDGNYHYLWQSSLDLNFSNPEDVATGTVYTPPNLTTSIYYRLVVTNNGVTAISSALKVTVVDFLAGTIGPVEQSVALGLQPISMVADEITGGSGIFSYQWMASTDGTSWQSIPGASTVGYNPGVTKQLGTTYYRLAVTSDGYTIYTSTAAINVLPGVNAGEISTPEATLDPGMEVEPLLATPASLGICDGNYTYEWEQSTDGNIFTETGVSSQNYSPGSIYVTTWYRRKVICGLETRYTKVIQMIVQHLADYSSFNYLRTREITKSGVMDQTAANTINSPYEVKQTTQYVDGLGRPIQTVVQQESPSQKDVITVQIYDQYNRSVRQFLPFSSSSADGNVKLTPLTDQLSFNTEHFPQEQYYFGRTLLETSPLSRVMKQSTAGSAWQPIDDNPLSKNDHTTKKEYLFNVVNEVIAFTFSTIDNQFGVEEGNYYAANQLTANKTYDEKNNVIIEYVDKEGHTICKKVQSGGTEAAPVFASTYYIYDDLGNLVTVLPPEAVEKMKTTLGLN